MMKTRTLPGGNLPPANIQWTEWQKYQSTHAEQFASLAAQPKWQQVGTNTVPSLGGGAGRVNVVRFDPVNTNTMYAGTAGGGVWKSTDAGSSWTALGDNYPVTSIADIAIDATDGNNIYVATGDGAGYELGTDFWGGVYTAGILRSTDGGATWFVSGKILPQDYIDIIQRLIINPSNNKVLLAATRLGIYRSIDGGSKWKLVLSSHCYDMEWNTADPKTVYAGGDGNLYKSIDGGSTWNYLRTGAGAGRMSIEVSKQNSSVIYILTSSSFQKTTDGGTSWTTQTYPSGAGFYGYYDLMLSCSDANSNYLIAGGLNTVKSTNGGASWSYVDNSSYTAPNYVHADKHAGIFFPGSTTSFVVGTDGGIFKTVNGGSNWTDLSNGLMIAQIYRIGTTPQNPNLVTSGWQDNGCNKWDGTSWKHIFGADGMETAIDYSNQNTIYESYQYGALNRSLDGGSSWTYIAPSSGDWITPFIIDPIVNTRLYYGTNALYKSDNRGTSWTAVAGVNFNSGYGSAIAVAPSNNNIVYAASLYQIFRADISNNTAKNITGTLPVGGSGINYIATSNTDPNKLWVAMAGYQKGNKVFSSTDGGTTWTNVSGTLPNLPVNTIVYQNGSNDKLFIGTDIGVYTIDNSVGDWIYFSKALPNVLVHELEINYGSNKLVAATYGRGIWQIDLPALAQPITLSSEKARPAELKANVFPNPSTGIVNIKVLGAKQPVSIDVYKLTGEMVASFVNDAVSASSIKLNISNQPFGNYILKIKSGESTTSKTVQLVKN
ncbi:MAG: T9SS type A sorting domain-containing protein [Chitinophagaceae bacterium]